MGRKSNAFVGAGGASPAPAAQHAMDEGGSGSGSSDGEGGNDDNQNDEPVWKFNDDNEEDDDDEEEQNHDWDAGSLEGDEGGSSGGRTKGRSKRKPLTPEEVEAYQKAEKRRGIIYLSSIPPFMKPMKIRHIFSQYGDIKRVFLQQEDPMQRKKRVKHGGNKKKKFVEGWVEFDNKKHAKRVASMLNCQIVGGKKSNYWHDDIWNIKYLSKFKWHHLAERMAYERKIREDKVRALTSQMKKDNEYYLSNIDQAKMLDGMRSRASGKKKKTAKPGISDVAKETVQRHFFQQAVIEP